MIGSKHLVFFTVALYVQSCVALPVYQEEYDYEGHHHEHHAPPPATSYATISTTHVKVQHPPVAPPKYASYASYAPSPYKYEYLSQPQTVYKYVSVPAAVSLQHAGGEDNVKYEEPSTPNYKYLAASPTYKYVQPPAVTTEPEAAEEPTNSLKYALKYERNAYRQEQDQQQEYEQQPAVRYKYVAVPTYKYVPQAVPEYGQHQLAAAASYDYADDKQQY